MAEPQPEIWHALEITADPAAAEALEFAFNELDTLGTEINHLRRKAEDSVIVAGYFNEQPAESLVQDALDYALAAYGFGTDVICSRNWRRFGKTDWLYDWKKHWKPTVIGKFIVAPPWETAEDADRHIIWIEPNMAFGTGTHETTQLCLEAIEHNYRPEETFLDVGTGTGILAIGAARMKAAKGIREIGQITGYDTDDGSIEIARENAALNGVAEFVRFHPGAIGGQTPAAGFVCANLTIDVILPLLPLLISKTRRVLLLSGILAEQEPQIIEALAGHGFRAPEVGRKGEWISVLAAI